MSDSNRFPINARLKVDGLWLLMVASAICYGALATLSNWFALGSDVKERPTLVMLGLFCFAFLCYGVALFLVVRVPASRKLFLGIIGSSCLFRVLMLPSIPMHEIDVYRYIWDGAVFAEGMSPYRYPPQDVLIAAADDAPAESDLARLVALRASSESLADSLGRIHFGTYPSPYPLVSQVVFAGAAWVTPGAASLFSRLVLIKGLFVLFDLATLLVVMGLVKEAAMHPGWSLAYGWCPLLMKEFANSGHLDSIAIFFTTAAVWLLVKSLRQAAGLKLLYAVATGSVLALAIGAKFYPVVLMPLFAALWWRRSGKGTLTVGVLSVGAVSLVLLYPLFRGDQEQPLEDKSPAVAHVAAPGQPLSPLAPSQSAVAESMAPRASDPSAGIRTFLKHWEMNDLIFMVVLENLRLQAKVEARQKPWFAVTPDAWSLATMKYWVTWADWISTKLHPDQPQLSAKDLHAPENLRAESFLLARIVTGGLFALLACWLAWRAAGQGEPREWCRAAMLTLAWFWLTCPTQNPWYWCWILPLLPFARYRTWYVLGAMTLLYYLRFWLSAHFVEPPVAVELFNQKIVLSNTYDGPHFFYFVMAWVEFAPCLVALGIEWLLDRRSKLRF